MIDGLYAVEFRTAGGEGGGTVVIANGSVNGGDRSHSYQGTLEETDQGIRATLTISQFNPAYDSVFGTAGDFEIDVGGATNEKGFELIGHVKGGPAHKIVISGHYLNPLA